MDTRNAAFDFTSEELKDPIKRRQYVLAICDELANCVQDTKDMLENSASENLADVELSHILAVPRLTLAIMFELAITKLKIEKTQWHKAMVIEQLNLLHHMKQEQKKG